MPTSSISHLVCIFLISLHSVKVLHLVGKLPEKGQEVSEGGDPTGVMTLNTG